MSIHANVKVYEFFAIVTNACLSDAANVAMNAHVQTYLARLAHLFLHIKKGVGLQFDWVSPLASHF